MEALKFEPLHSSVDAEFWYLLEKKKLLDWKLDVSPKSIFASYSSGYRSEFSSRVHLDSNAFDSSVSYPMHGKLLNANTKEEFDAFDKYQLLYVATKKIVDAIHSGEWVKNPSILVDFLLLSFASLKDHVFHYWFGFPAMVPAEPIYTTKSQKLDSVLNSSQLESLSTSWENFKSRQELNSRGFFLIHNSQVHSLSDWDSLKEEEVSLGFIDPSALDQFPGWPLKNFLVAASHTFKSKKFTVVCLRENPKEPGNLSGSITFNVSLGSLFGKELKCVGWEKNEKDKVLPRRCDVGFMMDPVKLAESSVSLNLNLMKWRFFPGLDLEGIAKQKCLLLGSGTLGCQVARNLLAWGIFNMTFVDRGKVAFSNPVRQPLFEFEDCLDGGKPKAKCAADHILKIYPKANVNAYELDIPMPGHVVTNESRKLVEDNVNLLNKLILEYDVIFLLMDSRESRWLPTVLGATHKKIVMTIALGFESFVVMRHGMGGKDSLGCYFCNDVVAPVDSSKDRTLDQQCTVTRPGTSAISGGLGVELLVSLLQHPMGPYAQASKSTDLVGEAFGLVPHQIRGSLSSFSTMNLIGTQYHQCTACSPKVLQQYNERGFEFLEKVFNQPSHLEEITGLKELREKSEAKMDEIVEEDDGFDML